VIEFIRSVRFLVVFFLSELQKQLSKGFFMLSTNMFNDTNIKVISYLDSAVSCSREDYDKYLLSLDESILRLKTGVEPTRFVIKKYLTQQESISIKDDMVSFDSERNVKLKMSVAAEEIRRSICGIESPEGADSIKWKKDPADSWLDKDLFAKLDQVGIASDLDVARKNQIHSASNTPELLKKN
jgi:hypothetical protein